MVELTDAARCTPISIWRADRRVNPLLFQTLKCKTPVTGVQKFGAGKEARTPDLNLGKVALYQLSYSRSFEGGPKPASRGPLF